MMNKFYGIFLFPCMFFIVGCLPPRGLSYSEFGDENFDEKLDFVNIKQVSEILEDGESSSKVELKQNECYQGRTINLKEGGIANLLEQKSCSDLALDTYINRFFALPDGEILEVICVALYPEKGIDRLAEEVSYIGNTPICPNNISDRKVSPRYRKHSVDNLSSDWIFLHRHE